MAIFEGLIPNKVWFFFEEICKIPHPSNKEEQLAQFLMSFAAERQLEVRKDETGNVLIRKPATAGKENLKPVCLQTHIDMVCEKNADKELNFETDPIEPFIDGEWVKAKGTTLGADDGIGVAAALAILDANDVEHGPIEALFTVAEETGLTGAAGLSPELLYSQILLNLDSEEDDEFCIGCAGGIDTVITLKYRKRGIPKKSVAFEVSVSGLLGGHSGEDIGKGLANSNKILNRFLWDVAKDCEIRIAKFDGGNLRNAIPREATAIITLPQQNVEKFVNFYNQFFENLKLEYRVTEPNLNISITETKLPKFVMNKKSQFRLLNSLYACPHGVIAWSQDIAGLVETSTNLASVKFIENNQIEVTTSQRSSIHSAKINVASMVESSFLLAKATVRHNTGYPGWKPNPDSEIVKIISTSFEKLYGKKPVIKAIHAGLECGLLKEKYPQMDMIAMGPTIKGPHSPDERLHIESVKRFWDLLLEVLKNIPATE